MAFHAYNFEDPGEYNYYTGYETVPFQQPSSSPNYETDGYEIVPFQDPSTLNCESFNAYDIVPYQDSSFYSSHEYTDPNFFERAPSACYNSYDPFVASSYANYSTNYSIEPKLLEYNPIFYDTHYVSSDTRFIVSYSNADHVLDDTVFDDYDPTPYDGGYDITQAYGKPLQPSDQICYPRIKTDNETKKMPISEPILEKEQPNVVNELEKKPVEGPKCDNGEMKGVFGNYGNGSFDKPMLEKEQPNVVNELEKKPVELGEGEEIAGSKCDNGEMRGVFGSYGNGSYEKPTVEFQGSYGYGLEAMDLCEGLFGYWPCLDKKIRRECGYCEQVVCEEDQWKSAAADYLFASPYTYSGDGVGNYQYHRYN